MASLPDIVPEQITAACKLRDVIFFLHSQTPPSLPKVFLLDLLGSHLAKSGLTTRAVKLLTI